VADTNLDTMPSALRRAWPLLEAPPEAPDTRHGYLDLLGPEPLDASGPVQAMWQSTVGARLYERAQVWLRRWLTSAQLPGAALRLPPGGRALDIGSGPGNITATLGRAVGPDGVALGVDVSEPMLLRAVANWSARNVGFLRADAQRLPFHGNTFDAVTCLAALQLIPDPAAALAQLCRVLAPGGRLAIMVPTVRGGVFERLTRLSGRDTGLVFFDPDELADHLQANGVHTVHTRQRSAILWVLGRKG
jgi:arsenite methyltransferase